MSMEVQPAVKHPWSLGCVTCQQNAEARVDVLEARCSEVAKELRKVAAKAPRSIEGREKLRALASLLVAPDDAPQEPTRSMDQVLADARKIEAQMRGSLPEREGR